ncbi:MAG: hypothetical protein KDC31_00535 [Saprospiraceae bacterium]|nr:hypothetical protein [Saprospiraceae bacterium]MCB0589751.1 hypothetical protein [Saprospiraceae bacterium]HQP78193.1 hypothetical protein [Saprospiraceae bacterium]
MSGNNPIGHRRLRGSQEAASFTSMDGLPDALPDLSNRVEGWEATYYPCPIAYRNIWTPAGNERFEKIGGEEDRPRLICVFDRLCIQGAGRRM